MTREWYTVNEMYKVQQIWNSIRTPSIIILKVKYLLFSFVSIPIYFTSYNLFTFFTIKFDSIGLILICIYVYVYTYTYLYIYILYVYVRVFI